MSSEGRGEGPPLGRVVRGVVRRGDRGNAETRSHLARALTQQEGVRRAAVVTGDPRDLDGLARALLVPPSWPAPPHVDDLVVVVEADTVTVAVDALSQLDSLIANGRAPGCPNAVRRGAVAVLSPSDSAIREVTTLVHHYGGGISRAVRIPDDDLLDGGAGRVALETLDELARDDDTAVVVLASTPPSPWVAARVLDRAVTTDRAVVACFLGYTAPAPHTGVTLTATLEDAARAAASLSGAGTVSNHPTLRVTLPRFTREQRWLRAFYAGGTLAYEALALLSPPLRVATNLRATSAPHFATFTDAAHTLVDLGDHHVTGGRAHPRRDLTPRLEAIRSVANDPTALALLLDVPLGDGAHPDPGVEIASVVREAREVAAARGGVLVTVASVTGTEGDAQQHTRQIHALLAAGVEVCSSNAAAVRRARSVLLGEWP